MRRADQISRRLKLRQLEVLLAVSQFGSMAKAAEHLAITQPVVSKTIGDLESTLGIKLFDRSSRGVELTFYGRALVTRSTAIFNDLRTGITELESLADPTTGEIRIGSSEAVAAGMLGAIIDRLSRKYPRISFEVTLGGGLTDLQYQRLQAHSIDLIIGRFPSVIPDDVEGERLYYERVLVASGRKSPWLRHRKIDLADLVDEAWCLPSLESYPWTATAEVFRARGLELPHNTVTTRSILLTNTLLATGRFLTVLPQTVLHFCSKSLSLQILPVDLPAKPWPVGILTLKDRTLSPAARLFIDCVREVARPLAKNRS